MPTALVLELEKRRRTPVVMIERPKGFACPVVANLFASRDRIARMVGAEPGGFNDAWVRALAHLTPPTVVSERTRARTRRAGQRAGRGRAADQPPLREGRRALHRLRHPGVQGSGHRRAQSELSTAPAQRTQPLRREPAFARPHLGAFAAMRCAPAKPGSRHRDRRCIRRSISRPAPRWRWRSTSSTSAGALLGRPVELVKCKTIDVEVPAEAEFVLEGRNSRRRSTRTKDRTASTPATRPTARPGTCSS